MPAIENARPCVNRDGRQIARGTTQFQVPRHPSAASPHEGRKAPAGNAATRPALPRFTARTNNSGMSYTHRLCRRLTPPAGSLWDKVPCLIPFSVFDWSIRLLDIIIIAGQRFVKGHPLSSSNGETSAGLSERLRYKTVPCSGLEDMVNYTQRV